MSNPALRDDREIISLYSADIAMDGFAAMWPAFTDVRTTNIAAFISNPLTANALRFGKASRTPSDHFLP
jgi:hypothetical protein